MAEQFVLLHWTEDYRGCSAQPRLIYRCRQTNNQASTQKRPDLMGKIFVQEQTLLAS